MNPSAFAKTTFSMKGPQECAVGVEVHIFWHRIACRIHRSTPTMSGKTQAAALALGNQVYQSSVAETVSRYHLFKLAFSPPT
jgi:hypothetical protein